jgi:cell division protein FtsL
MPAAIKKASSPNEVQPAEPDAMSDTPKRGWLSFSIRELMLLTAIVALALALIYTRWPTRPIAPGRYQIEVDSGSNGSDGRTLFVDTATGKIWVHYASWPSDSWQEMQSPAGSK